MSFRLCVAACAAGAIALGAARAEAEAITWDEAARRVLQASPALAVMAAEAEAAAARIDAAALKPGLEASTELENVAGTGEARGVDAAELTLSLGSTFERGAKRSARVAAAVGARELLAVEHDARRRALLTDARRQFVAVAADQQRVALAERALAQAVATLAVIEPRVSTARSPRTELLAAEIARSRAASDLEAARRTLAASQSALATQWGAPGERPEVRFDLTDLPDPGPPAALRERLAAAPELARLAADGRLQDARIALARAEGVPDWRWQVGVRRLQGSKDQALVAGVTVPLGRPARSRPAIGEARAERSRVEAALASKRIELDGELAAALERLAAARSRFTSITRDQLPRAAEVRELTARGYAIGRFAYRELAAAEGLVLELESGRLDAARDYHLACADIERLAGRPLDAAKE